MKIRYKVLLAIILFALPLAARLAWFYRGIYTPPVIAEIDGSQIAPALLEHRTATDEPQQYDSRVVVDLSHVNNLQLNDLVPLYDRLETRGVEVKSFEVDSGGSLETELRGATALVVAAPSSKYTSEEKAAIKAFVADGGRLLLVADPTRPVPIPAEEMDLFTVSFPTSSIPAINSLANLFGVVYFDDYLYNIVANEGNYRNIKLVNLNPASPLTKDLESVIFFASHSLRGSGTPLITGDENTLSPVRRGETGLAVAMLAANEQVLALGDISFLTPSYHTVADNDRFLSHIADWLAGAERQRDLEDFPYLFEGPVDLVQVTGDYLDPRLIAGTSKLQQVFEQAGLALTIRAEAGPGRDALLVGTFKETERVQEYLTTAGISITLRITQTAEVTATPVAAPPASPAPVRPGVTATVTPTATLPASISPTPELTQTLAVTETTSPESADSLIEVEGLGTIQAKGTSLFVVNRNNDHVVVTALAEDGQTLMTALDNLTSGNLAGCILGDPVTVCSAGVVEEVTTDTSSTETTEDTTGLRIFILSVDTGTEGQRTSVLELQALLGESYDVTAWSTSLDGIPSEEDITGYDAYIVDSGDYAYNVEDSVDPLAALSGVSAGIMYIGEQPFPSFDPAPANISDLQVNDVSHPIASGLAAEQVITLSPSESGVPAVVIPPAQEVYDDTNIVFTRGPSSAEAGRPALIGAVEKQSSRRIILATFAFYRLPEDIQPTFAVNAAKWLMGQE